ncbi:hypothetical protein MICRO8M_90083 [Microbacterium sp. 8M]|nr:hypothetical protein MICRO8M_90083 [Microbacterium sp. 8M]
MDLAAGVVCFAGDDDEAARRFAVQVHRPGEPGRGEEPVAVEVVRDLRALLARPLEVAAHRDDAPRRGECRRPEPRGELLDPRGDERRAGAHVLRLLSVPPHELEETAVAAVADDRRGVGGGDGVGAVPFLPPLLWGTAVRDELLDQLVRLGVHHESSAHDRYPYARRHAASRCPPNDRRAWL